MAQINGSGLSYIWLLKEGDKTYLFIACREINFANILHLIPDHCRLYITALGGKDNNGSYLEHEKILNSKDKFFSNTFHNPCEPLKIMQMDVCVKELRNYVGDSALFKVTKFDFTSQDEDYLVKSVGCNAIAIELFGGFNKLFTLVANKLPLISTLLEDAYSNQGSFMVYSDLRKMMIMPNVENGEEFYKNLDDFAVKYIFNRQHIFEV